MRVPAALVGLAIGGLGALGAWELAHARTLDDATRRDLARVLVAEADGSRPDWLAILWVLEHRRQRAHKAGRPRTLRETARYSALWRSRSPRAREIRALGHADPEVPHGPRRARQWEAALRFVDTWAAGATRDPCPTATHWDRQEPPWPWVRVGCGPTVNLFGRRP